MNMTGHPFIDVGYAIATNLADKKSIDECTSQELRDAVGRLQKYVIDESETEARKRIRGGLSSLKILKDFWQNNPLMGINVEQVAQYENVLVELAADTIRKKPGYCQICGANQVVGEINRSWFPLSGSPDSDPTTLPELGGKKICANCFRAVVVLPMGCNFCKTGAYFYHVLDSSLQVEVVSDATSKIMAVLLTTGNQATRVVGNQQLKQNTRLTGRLELLEIVSGHLLWDHTQPGSLHSLSELPESGATMIAFSNGKAARLIQLHLPAQALLFLSYMKERGKGVQDAFINWAEKCVGEIFERICDDIELRRSLAPLIRVIVRNRKKKDVKLTKEEKLVLQDYENVALQKKERFDMLERLAERVNRMEDKYRESFVKQLGNAGSSKTFWELLRKFAKPEKTGLVVTAGELRAIATDTNPVEAISLLYLLCISEQSKEN